MKRILTSLILIISLMAACPFSSSAQKNKKESEQRLMMKSDASQSATGHKFVIDGHVALDIPDSCYNIYITDIDKEITASDFVACVPVKNKRFRFETDLSTMKSGRIRAIMPDDKLCPAWIELFFIPGFTLDMTVHNGYYDLHNKSEYQFMTDAWLNKDAMAVLFESMGAPSRKTRHSGESSLQDVLLPYKDLLDDLEIQLELLNTQTLPLYDEKQAIIKRMDQINAKMEAIIDKYAKSFKY